MARPRHKLSSGVLSDCGVPQRVFSREPAEGTNQPRCQWGRRYGSTTPPSLSSDALGSRSCTVRSVRPARCPRYNDLRNNRNQEPENRGTDEIGAEQLCGFTQRGVFGATRSIVDSHSISDTIGGGLSTCVRCLSHDVREGYVAVLLRIHGAYNTIGGPRRLL